MIIVSNRLTGFPTTFFAAPESVDATEAPRNSPSGDAVKSPYDVYRKVRAETTDLNKNCYWDKRSIKIKTDIEKSVARAKAQKRQETKLVQSEIELKKMAESSNRRSNAELELYML